VFTSTYKMVKISYAICVCNEDREVKSLINFLLKVKDEEDEINILVDSKNVTQEVSKVLKTFEDKIVVNEREFDGNFSEHRNYHTTKCTGDYIFVIDADEMPQEALINNIKTFEGDIMYIPRINICPGYTAEWIVGHKFNLNEMGWINWPDYQGRYYKNNGEIKWSKGVHEKPESPNPDKIAKLEAKPLIALWHVKNVERQDRQNAYYKSLEQIV
jgi:6-pyruvoyl-tetrahydropterin synthase